MSRLRRDADSVWKDTVKLFFRDFLKLLFPEVHQAISWKVRPQFLDLELRKLHPIVPRGRKRADLIAQVQLKSQQPCLIVVHTEIQLQHDPQFPLRMFAYYYHLREIYQQEVVSLAVIGDTDPNWRPDQYQHALLGCEVQFKYPIVKLIDLDEAQLEESRNPIAALVLAHLKTQRYRNDPKQLFIEKLRLIRKLLEGGYTKAHIIDLYREVDYLMALPKELERDVKSVVKRIQKERGIKRLSFIEREAMEEGVRKGIQQGKIESQQESILLALTTRFGETPEDIVHAIRSEESLERLKSLLQFALTVPDLETFRKHLQGE